MIELKCEHCKKQFERRLCNHKQTIKFNRRTFCSLSCAAYCRNESMTPEYWKKQYEKQKKTFDIKTQSGNRKDKHSPFRFFLNKGHGSVKKHLHTMNIDEKYLKQLWERQKGICPYTGIKMILPETTHKSHQIKSLKRASLDRIDSSKGYLKDNVEFVCYAINSAKNNFKKEEMKSFIKEIISSQNTLSITQGQPT